MSHHPAIPKGDAGGAQHHADVLLVTVSETETRAVFAAVLAATGASPTGRPIGDRTYYDLGVIGGARVWLVRSEEGAGTPGGGSATLYTAIGVVRPAAILLVGTAVGLDPANQRLGDILIARKVAAYEPQRIGTLPDGAPVEIPRGDRASASTLALDRCNDAALHWPAERARVWFGLLLSGEKLVMHTSVAAALLEHEPEAIGAEQEGAALYTAAHQHKFDWIVIKAVARWPDERHAEQALAARNAAEFTVQMLARGGFAPTTWDTKQPLVAIPPTPSTLTVGQRAMLLDRLARRYQELLGHALPHQVRLQRGLHTRPDAVDSAWRRMLLRGPQASSQPAPPGTPPLELFDGRQGQLLVLGAPGAGKSRLIVELAQALTQRALADGQARIPVVLNVAAWRSGQSLRDWLRSILRNLLDTSKRFAAQLAKSDDLLLLLDGLDEVAADHRTACVVAINAYLAERDLAPPLVVGCRSREYADMGAKLKIAGALELEPLELPVIERALVGVPAVQGVLQALQTDESLRKLATTPLFVNVLLLAYGGQDVPIAPVQNLDERHKQLWNAYMRRMLQQRPLQTWTPSQVLGLLRFLGCSLRARSETDLLLDGLQPDLLSSDSLARQYRGLLGLLFAPFGALIFSLIGIVSGPFGVAAGAVGGGLLLGLVGFMGGDFSRFGLSPEEQPPRSVTELIRFFSSDWRMMQVRGLAIALMSGLLMGLINGLLGGLLMGLGVALCSTVVIELSRRFAPHSPGAPDARFGLLPIRRGEALRWSGDHAWRYLHTGGRSRLAWIMGITGLVGVLLALSSDLLTGLLGWGFLCLFFGPLIVLPEFLDKGWIAEDLPERNAPLQGIHASLKSGLIRILGIALPTGLVCGLVLGLFWGMSRGLWVGVLIGLIGGVWLGFLIGLAQGLVSGLGAVIQHYALRLTLSRAGLLPFHAVTFLDAMSERLLLERDEALYRFHHRQLCDFIADLSDDDIARLAREVDGEGANR